jgi:hypothetical protein
MADNLPDAPLMLRFAQHERGTRVIKQDDELDKLEEDIRRLKNKYDQFFAGIQKLPPQHDRRNVEIYIYELGKQKMRDNARRFRYNTLLSRYNQFREMWSRKIREREEGPLDFRRRQAAMSSSDLPAPPPPPEERVTSPRADPYVKVAPGSNGEELRRLYDEIQREHLKMGKLPSITIEQLGQMVQKQSEVVRSRYNVNSVAFRVETVDGKVKLKAKPLQD